MVFGLDKLIEIVMGKLVDTGIKKIASILGANSEMEALQRNVKNIRPVLVDLETKKIESKAIALWLAQLRNVLDDSLKLLTKFAEAQGKNTILSKTKEFFAKNNTPRKLRDINSTLEKLYAHIPTLHLLEILPNRSVDRERTVFSVMAMILDGLVSAVMDAGIKEIVAIIDVESDMEVLQMNMERIRLVLVDVESKKTESKSINHWLAEVREVAYDVEDLLDDFAAAKLGKSESIKDTTLSIPALSRGKNNSSTSESVKDITFRIPWPFRSKNNSSTSKSVKDTILSFPGISQMNEAYLKNKISTRIKNINSNLREIYSEAPSLQLLASLPDADKKVSSLITGTSSFQLDYEIVGINDATIDLVNRIIGDSNRAHSLFAITGMGGIGKTTLARKVYNHDLIRNHFDENTVWVCVSSYRSGTELLKEIIRSIGKKDYSESCVSLYELSSKVIEVVKEKRVFIVLDDIWNSDVWEKFLKVPLLKAKHSRILITTRNRKVAMKMTAAHTHSMTEMNPSDGWSMLCKIVFGEKDKGDMNELADVGKEIVHKCKGLPLAIKVVGGVLRTTDRTIDAWKGVLSSTTWSMPDLPEDIPPSLLLSYEDLPLHLKQCFTYCSLFPEDYQFSRFKLENLWIAEGFIKKEEGMGVDELVMRNLLQVFDLEYDSTYYKMHDLLRSLAIYVSQKQYIYLQSNTSGLTRRHHLSFIGNDKNDEEVSQEIKEEDRVRTLLLSNNRGFTKVSSELLSRLRRLRVLDLHDTRIETLPDSLGDLIHLKFLNVSNTNLTKLPDKIKNLKNLETLEATGLYRLTSLPNGISELFNLRCLRVNQLYRVPIGLGNLKNLRVLEGFVVNSSNSANIKELKDLSQLTDLSIYNLERVASKEDAQEAAIETKKSLEILTLIVGNSDSSLSGKRRIEKIEEVFAGIRFPQNLTKLSIDGFFGEQLPDHMTSDHLRQLTSLELTHFKLLRRLPSLGDLPKLERLKIWDVCSVVELGSEFLGSLKFPKLQELELQGMRKLERTFEVEKGAFPCLVKLSISHCPELNSLGEGLNHATSLKMLKASGLRNLTSIENLSSISELAINWNTNLCSVKNLPSLKIMDIHKSDLEDVRNVGELNYLHIQNDKMETLPRWLENITPPKKLLVEGSEELVLGIQESVEDQNIIKKCLYAEVRSDDGSKYISYREDHLRYNSKSTGSSGASSSSVTIT